MIGNFLLFLQLNNHLLSIRKIMRKKEIRIEHPLHCTSERTVWALIGTDAGLSRWIADEVEQADDVLIFRWGDPFKAHQVHKARILEIERNHFIRFRWDSYGEDEYVEIKMCRGDLDRNFTLYITDFADAGEEDDQRALWDGDFERLYLSAGI